eukprot:2729771-Lingulodinium_polyedra.AAC.1
MTEASPAVPRRRMQTGLRSTRRGRSRRAKSVRRRRRFRSIAKKAEKGSKCFFPRFHQSTYDKQKAELESKSRKGHDRVGAGRRAAVVPAPGRPPDCRLVLTEDLD